MRTLSPSNLEAPTPCAQVVLELFLEKAQATGAPDADSPAMVALGADRGTYRELPAAEKCAYASRGPLQQQQMTFNHGSLLITTFFSGLSNLTTTLNQQPDASLGW